MKKKTLLGLAATVLLFTGCAEDNAFLETSIIQQKLQISKLNKEIVDYVGKKDLKELFKQEKNNPNVYLVSGQGSYSKLVDISETQRKRKTQYSLLYAAATQTLKQGKKGFKVLYPVALQNKKLISLNQFQEECATTIINKSCGNVYRYCAKRHRYDNDGFLVIEVSDTKDDQMTYFNARDLKNNIENNKLIYTKNTWIQNL